MRAAQLDSESYVINYAEVEGLDLQFVDPLDSVIGSFWNGTAFVNPIPPSQLTGNAPIIAASFSAALRRKAQSMQDAGKTFEAVQLLLQAQGIQS